jgi:hypothetical protein
MEQQFSIKHEEYMLNREIDRFIRNNTGKAISTQGLLRKFIELTLLVGSEIDRERTRYTQAVHRKARSQCGVEPRRPR